MKQKMEKDALSTGISVVVEMKSVLPGFGIMKNAHPQNSGKTHSFLFAELHSFHTVCLVVNSSQQYPPLILQNVHIFYIRTDFSEPNERIVGLTDFPIFIKECR